MAYRAPYYFKTPQGIVFVHMCVEGGTAGADLATLPVGYRPSAPLLFTMEGSTGVFVINIHANGTLDPETAAGTARLAFMASFRAEQ